MRLKHPLRILHMLPNPPILAYRLREQFSQMDTKRASLRRLLSILLVLWFTGECGVRACAAGNLSDAQLKAISSRSVTTLLGLAELVDDRGELRTAVEDLKREFGAAIGAGDAAALRDAFAENPNSRLLLQKAFLTLAEPLVEAIRDSSELETVLTVKSGFAAHVDAVRRAISEAEADGKVILARVEEAEAVLVTVTDTLEAVVAAESPASFLAAHLGAFSDSAQIEGISYKITGDFSKPFDSAITLELQYPGRFTATLSGVELKIGTDNKVELFVDGNQIDSYDALIRFAADRLEIRPDIEGAAFDLIGDKLKHLPLPFKVGRPEFDRTTGKVVVDVQFEVPGLEFLVDACSGGLSAKVAISLDGNADPRVEVLQSNIEVRVPQSSLSVPIPGTTAVFVLNGLGIDGVGTDDPNLNLTGQITPAPGSGQAISLNLNGTMPLRGETSLTLSGVAVVAGEDSGVAIGDFELTVSDRRVAGVITSPSEGRAGDITGFRGRFDFELTHDALTAEGFATIAEVLRINLDMVLNFSGDDSYLQASTELGIDGISGSGTFRAEVEEGFKKLKVYLSVYASVDLIVYRPTARIDIETTEPVNLVVPAATPMKVTASALGVSVSFDMDLKRGVDLLAEVESRLRKSLDLMFNRLASAAAEWEEEKREMFARWENHWRDTLSSEAAKYGVDKFSTGYRPLDSALGQISEGGKVFLGGFSSLMQGVGGQFSVNKIGSAASDFGKKLVPRIRVSFSVTDELSSIVAAQADDEYDAFLAENYFLLSSDGRSVQVAIRDYVARQDGLLNGNDDVELTAVADFLRVLREVGRSATDSDEEPTQEQLLEVADRLEAYFAAVGGDGGQREEFVKQLRNAIRDDEIEEPGRPIVRAVIDDSTGLARFFGGYVTESVMRLTAVDGDGSKNDVEFAPALAAVDKFSTFKRVTFRDVKLCTAADDKFDVTRELHLGFEDAAITELKENERTLGLLARVFAAAYGEDGRVLRSCDGSGELRASNIVKVTVTLREVDFEKARYLAKIEVGELDSAGKGDYAEMQRLADSGFRKSDNETIRLKTYEHIKEALGDGLPDASSRLDARAIIKHAVQSVIERTLPFVRVEGEKGFAERRLVLSNETDDPVTFELKAHKRFAADGRFRWRWIPSPPNAPGFLEYRVPPRGRRLVRFDTEREPDDFGGNAEPLTAARLRVAAVSESGERWDYTDEDVFIVENTPPLGNDRIYTGESHETHVFYIQSNLAPAVRRAVVYRDEGALITHEGEVPREFLLPLLGEKVDDVLDTLVIEKEFVSGETTGSGPSTDWEATLPISVLRGDAGTATDGAPLSAVRVTLRPDASAAAPIPGHFDDRREFVRIRYRHPTNPWRAIYRLRLPDGGIRSFSRGELFGWFLFENATTSAWRDAQVLLKDGLAAGEAADGAVPTFRLAGVDLDGRHARLTRRQSGRVAAAVSPYLVYDHAERCSRPVQFLRIENRGTVAIPAGEVAVMEALDVTRKETLPRIPPSNSVLLSYPGTESDNVCVSRFENRDVHVERVDCIDSNCVYLRPRLRKAFFRIDYGSATVGDPLPLRIKLPEEEDWSAAFADMTLGDEETPKYVYVSQPTRKVGKRAVDLLKSSPDRIDAVDLDDHDPYRPFLDTVVDLKKSGRHAALHSLLRCPNLVVEGVKIYCTSLAEGMTPYADVSLRNLGPHDAVLRRGKLLAKIDGLPLPSVFVEERALCLRACQTRTFRVFGSRPVPAGDYDVTVTVDPSDTVAEWSENDNESTVAVTVE